MTGWGVGGGVCEVDGCVCVCGCGGVCGCVCGCVGVCECMCVCVCVCVCVCLFHRHLLVGSLSRNDAELRACVLC
mgnify:CR=1 FL=1